MSSYDNISEEGFQFAHELSCKKMASMNPEEICRNSGASRIGDDRILIQYLNRSYQVAISTGEVSLKEKEEDVPIKDKILILHYLTQARGTPFKNKLITYGQIEGGKLYAPVFVKRNLDPILKCFAHRPELLLEVAQKVGGQKSNYGDVSVAIDAFPMVRIFIIIWKGDDEVSPNGTILFDGNIPDYLTSEDVCVLTETLVGKLVRMA